MLQRKRAKIIMIVICSVIAAVAVAAFALWSYLTSGLNQVKLDTEDLAIVQDDSVDQNAWDSIQNIAVFGIDSTEEQASYGDQYRSDLIIVASIIPEENTVKLTSILRDSKVPIEGHDPQKINAAYKYGFAPLAIKTLNQNFRLNIQDYVTIDFAGIEHLVNALGGIEVELTEEESRQVEGSVPGWNTLDGYQVMLYARIRKIDSDYYRASRQQTVISCLFEKIRNTSVLQMPGMIRELLECVETSLSYGDILKIILSLDIRNLNLVNNTIPDIRYETDLWGGIDRDHGEWVYIYDLDQAAERLHQIIYGQ